MEYFTVICLWLTIVGWLDSLRRPREYYAVVSPPYIEPARREAKVNMLDSEFTDYSKGII